MLRLATIYPPHPPQEKCDRYQLDRNVAGPQARSEGRGEDKGPLTSTWNNHQYYCDSPSIAHYLVYEN
jgi:hypothetical protein